MQSELEAMHLSAIRAIAYFILKELLLVFVIGIFVAGTSTSSMLVYYTID